MSEKMKNFIIIVLILMVIGLLISTIAVLVENYNLKKPVEEAISKCEENLVRSQHCDIIISATPQIKKKIDEKIEQKN